MRVRWLHATLSAAVLLASGATLVRAQDIDLFANADPAATSNIPVKPDMTAAAAPAAPTPATVPMAKASLTIEPSDWSPGHAASARSQAETGKRGDGKTASKLDDPDTVVKPAVPAPSQDPLDAAKPAEPGKAPEPAAAQVVPLAPLPTAIKAALDKRGAAEIRGFEAAERRKERAAIAAYYAARKYQPLWSGNGAAIAAVDPVLARLAKAGDDALGVADIPAKVVAKGTDDEVASSEIAMTEAVVAYSRQATGARVDPRVISPLIGARPQLADPAKVLDEVAAAGSAAGDRLAALNPKDPRYAALRDRLASLHGVRAPATTPIPAGPVLRIGMHDARVPLLRARLGVMALDLVADADEYDMELAEAVSAYQRSNGLRVSGRLDTATAASLSGAGKGSSLEGPLVANMEMWRWMPRDLGSDRIEVDVPAYVVTVFHDGEPVATNRVVVGKPDTPTPIFSNTMKYAIVNPVWNVPQSIIKKEMMAKIDRGGGLRGFEVSYNHGQLTVKQPSGPKNALGQIKFMFPNDFSVYLHDTPSKSLFSASKRAFSHGCVRVDQPFDFAFSVLNDGVPEGGKVVWSQKRLEKMIGDSERYVNLPKPLPIHIMYFTATADAETGKVVQREDIYGYARAVAAALKGEARPAAAVVAERKPRRTAERPARAATARAAVATDEDPR